MFDPAFPNSVISDNLGRCAAMTLPKSDDDLPMYRCTGEGTRRREGRLVCEAHSRELANLYCSDGRDERDR
jgi:hypothetical protein